MVSFHIRVSPFSRDLWLDYLPYLYYKEIFSIVKAFFANWGLTNSKIVLCNASARYYDPTLGRFLSEDPAKNGANWYAYCHNSPLKYVDPSGQVPVPVVTGAIGAVVGAGIGVYQSYKNEGHFDLVTVGKWTLGGAAVGASLGAVGAGIFTGYTSAITVATETGASVWLLPPVVRGQLIEKALGGMCTNFPTIDKFVIGANNIATSVISIKSLDIFAKNYQNGNALFNTIMAYAKDVSTFNGSQWTTIKVMVNSNTQRILQLVIPAGASSTQLEQIRTAINTASSRLGVQINVIVVK